MDIERLLHLALEGDTGVVGDIKKYAKRTDDIFTKYFSTILSLKGSTVIDSIKQRLLVSNSKFGTNLQKLDNLDYLSNISSDNLNLLNKLADMKVPYYKRKFSNHYETSNNSYPNKRAMTLFRHLQINTQDYVRHFFTDDFFETFPEGDYALSLDLKSKNLNDIQTSHILSRFSNLKFLDMNSYVIGNIEESEYDNLMSKLDVLIVKDSYPIERIISTYIESKRVEYRLKQLLHYLANKEIGLSHLYLDTNKIRLLPKKGHIKYLYVYRFDDELCSIPKDLNIDVVVINNHVTSTYLVAQVDKLLKNKPNIKDVYLDLYGVRKLYSTQPSG